MSSPAPLTMSNRSNQGVTVVTRASDSPAGISAGLAFLKREKLGVAPSSPTVGDRTRATVGAQSPRSEPTNAPSPARASGSPAVPSPSEPTTIPLPPTPLVLSRSRSVNKENSFDLHASVGSVNDETLSLSSVAVAASAIARGSSSRAHLEDRMRTAILQLHAQYLNTSNGSFEASDLSIHTSNASADATTITGRHRTTAAAATAAAAAANDANASRSSVSTASITARSNAALAAAAATDANLATETMSGSLGSATDGDYDEAAVGGHGNGNDDTRLSSLILSEARGLNMDAHVSNVVMKSLKTWALVLDEREAGRMDSMSAREEISMLRAQLASLQTAFDAQALSRKRADEQYAMALSVGGGSGNGDGNGDGDRVDDGGASKPFDLSGVSQMEASVQQSFASMHSDFSRHLHLFPQDENIFQLNVDFIFQQRLHFGNQTVVYLAARRAPPHEPIAIKIIEDEHFSPEYPPQEVRVLGALGAHSNIIQLTEWYPLAGTNCYAVVYPYVPFVEIDGSDEAVTRQYMRDLLSALAHCHECGVIYRDVKPGNVLFDPRVGRAFLIDFDCAKEYDPYDRPTSKIGTDGYMAPEVENEAPGGYDLSVDVYSAGVVFLELIYGVEMKGDLIREDIETVLDNPGTMTPAKDLAFRMLDRRPYKRPTAQEALAHPYFQQ